MQHINLLIVEDKKTQIEEWEDALAGFNLHSERVGRGLRFVSKFARTYKEAREHLSTFNFSAAIIDIGLKDDDGQDNEDNTAGNKVLEDIMDSTMCLAWVYTAQQTDADIPKHLDDYIELIDRSAKPKSEVLEDLASKQNLLKSIITIKSQFSKSKAEHFYSAIGPRWSLWEQDASDHTDKAIIRHMATHLHASFLNETEKVHPEEYYFTGPMIEGALDTGDITVVDGQHYILVTPRCEIAQKKFKFYQFVEVEDMSEVLKEQEDKLVALKAELAAAQEDVAIKKKAVRDLNVEHSTAQKQANVLRVRVQQALKKASEFEGEQLIKENANVVDDISQLFEAEAAENKESKALDSARLELTKAGNVFDKAQKAVNKQQGAVNALLPKSNAKISLHVLPEVKQPSGDKYGPLHAQFERIVSVPKGDDKAIAKYVEGKYARLSNEFVPSFVERLGSHFSRIGTPDYSHPE